jgi:hypothetical protein
MLIKSGSHRSQVVRQLNRRYKYPFVEIKPRDKKYEGVEGSG